MMDQSKSPSQNPSVAPLESILPDPGQPRRLLPGDLAEAVSTGAMTPLEVMQEWLRRAESDTAEAALRHNVRELKRLAETIAQHGLISPISVRLRQPEEPAPPEIIYFIVTGERRYWAHVYLQSQGLQIHEGQTSSSPNQIKIILASPGITIRAQQLIENLLREDLNAIERAQGMVALRYELSGVNYSSPSSDQIDHEAEAPDDSSPSSTPAEAAPVNYSSPRLVPWSQVEASLGISKRYRIFVISVLQLNEEAQALVTAHNLAEMTIRPITQKLRNKPALQLRALEQLVEWQSAEEEEGGPGRPIVASVKEFVDQLLIEEFIGDTEQEAAAPAKRTRAVSSAPVVRFRDKVRQTLDFLSRLKKSDRAELTSALNRGDFAEVMLDLRHLREQIDAILETVSQPQDIEAKMIPPTLPPDAPEASDPDATEAPADPDESNS